MDRKTCTECGQTKPLDDFHRSKAGKFGRRSQCKPCRNAALKQDRIDNPEKHRVISRRYYARHSEQRRVDAREYYHAHRAAINARNRERRAANPDELRARDRKYYQSSHAKRLEDARRYYKKHKDDPKFKARNVANAKQYRQRYPQKTKEIITRAKALYRIRLRNAEGTHTMAEWRAILARYGNKCLCCGATENISLDHIIGLASGGTNFATNLQPLCVSCNTSKQAKYIDFRPDAYWGDWL